MKREDVVALAIELGWVPWNRLRRGRDVSRNSSYQCFRRGDEYAWIGLRYVERSGEDIALDFIMDDPKEILT